jgi:glycosyltransferase involved in cell wall biosynthesis
LRGRSSPARRRRCSPWVRSSRARYAGFALDLFDTLAARGVALQWHFVGAPGWLAEDTVRRIHAHPALGTRLFWWTDLADAELAWLYRHAAALVAVSRAEGFGLPLVEARLHGTPVFASDIAVFREVLGDEARYLPLSDPGLAAAALEDFVLTAPRRPRVPRPRSRAWRREAARELLDVILRIRRPGDGQGSSKQPTKIGKHRSWLR